MLEVDKAYFEWIYEFEKKQCGIDSVEDIRSIACSRRRDSGHYPINGAVIDKSEMSTWFYIFFNICFLANFMICNWLLHFANSILNWKVRSKLINSNNYWKRMVRNCWVNLWYDFTLLISKKDLMKAIQA